MLEMAFEARRIRRRQGDADHDMAIVVGAFKNLPMGIQPSECGTIRRVQAETMKMTICGQFLRQPFK